MKSKNRRKINTVAAITTLLGLIAHAESADPFKLVKGDVVVFAGGTNTVRAGKAGYLEALLTRRFADMNPRFRDLSWEGDTVFQQSTVSDRWREEAFGGWPDQLERVEATVVIAQFGKTEALGGKPGLARFVAAYDRLIDSFMKRTPRVVLVSPTPFEKPAPLLPDLSKRNADLKLYVEAIGKIAQQRGLEFVDVFTPFTRSKNESTLTSNGMHVIPEAQAVVASAVARGLGDTVTELGTSPETLRGAIVTKNTLWFEYWRPANWKCLFGDDSNRVFGRAAGDHPAFLEEWASYPALVAEAEKRIRKLATAE
jgi:hypothetical protein